VCSKWLAEEFHKLKVVGSSPTTPTKEYIMGEDIKDKIMGCVYKGDTYRQIQLKLGNPSRRLIRKTIQERAPELWDIIGDTAKLKLLRDKLFYGKESE